MIIVLGISLIITFISTLGMKVKEGLENNTTTQPSVTQKKTDTPLPPNLSGGAQITPPSTNSTNSTTNNTNSVSSNSIPEAKNTTESMNSMSGKRNRLDENAASVHDTYSDLNNILGNNNNSVNMDTKQLLEQQAQLSEAMKNMGPLIESAKTLMNGINFDGLNNLATSLVSKK
jgi:ABC-type transporter Mla subunit MlaD